jgi:hypothetical protein
MIKRTRRKLKRMKKNRRRRTWIKKRKVGKKSK